MFSTNGLHNYDKVFSTNGLHNYDMYIFQNFNGTGHRLTVQYDQYLVRLLQSVFSMAFLRCHQPRLGCVWKICMTSRPLALICVFLCTPMVLCGLSVLPRVLHEVFSTNGLHNYDMYIFQNFNGTGHRLTVQYDQYPTFLADNSCKQEKRTGDHSLTRQHSFQYSTQCSIQSSMCSVLLRAITDAMLAPIIAPTVSMPWSQLPVCHRVYA